MRLAPLGPVSAITIHCSATPEGRDVTAAQLNEWAIARFRQPSYHYLILLDGTVVENLSTKFRGAHTGGRNTGNIGICYVGGMNRAMTAAKDTRTLAQKSALHNLLRELETTYPQARILGHRDWPKVAKDCPSFSVSDWLKEFPL